MGIKRKTRRREMNLKRWKGSKLISMEDVGWKRVVDGSEFEFEMMN